jgi:parallel beta-helix repeat protein
VGGIGEGNFSYIQDAINISGDGDIIFVYNGVYCENIKANKSISLIGENKDSTIITGNNSDHVITIYSPWLNLTGFTIQLAPVSGIFIDSPGNCNIYHNNINFNSIGIYIISSKNTKIYNNTISNNSVIGINITSTQIPSKTPRNNIIFHNNFINNKYNVYDEGVSNNWSYQKEGNYYDDYFGLDKNNDGIGDTFYDIPGGENEDYFPLMMPYNGTIRLKEFYVDYESVYTMLIIGIIIAILFLLPIGYIWYKKTRHLR